MKNQNQKIKNQYVIIHNKNQNKNFYNMISPNKIKKSKVKKIEENIIKDYFINKSNPKINNKEIIKNLPAKMNNINKYNSPQENQYKEYKNYIEEEYNNQNYEKESGTERLHQIKDEYIEYLQKQLDENNKNLIKYETKINEFSKRYKNLIEDNKLLNETLNERTSKLNEIIQENENIKIQFNNNIENEKQIKLYYEQRIKEYEDKINESNNIINDLKQKNDLNKNKDINNENIYQNNLNENNEDELQLIKNQNLIYLHNIKSKDNTIELITKENEKLLNENKEYRVKIEEYTQKITDLFSTIKEKNNIINILKTKEDKKEDINLKEKELKICYSQENLSLNILNKTSNNNNKEKEIKLKEEISNNDNMVKNKKNNNEKINQSIDKLIIDNEENKMKIEMLNNKIKSFDNFEKKYFEFIKNRGNNLNNDENMNQTSNQNNDKNFRYLNLINEKNENNDLENKKEIDINDYKIDEKEKVLMNEEDNQKEIFNDNLNDGSENLDLKSYKKYKGKKTNKKEEEKEERKRKEEKEEEERIKREEIEKKEREQKEKEENEKKKEIKKEGPNYRYSFMYRRRLMKEKAEKERKEKEEKEKEEKEKEEKEKEEKEKEEKEKEEKERKEKEEEEKEVKENEKEEEEEKEEKEEKIEKEEKKETKKHGIEERPKDEKYEIKERVREMNRKRNYTHNPKAKKRFKISDELDVTEINTSSPVVPQNLSFSIDNKNNLDNLFLFGIDRNDILHIFDIRKRKWSKKKILEIEDISDTFQKDYQYEGTILYNTLNGLFILTGKKLDILYYYNSQNETINKICKFNNSHDNGSLMLEKEYNRIFVFGGKNTLSCEYYSFEDKNVNIIPDLNKERANASFISCNDKIFSFFGFSYEKNNYSGTIEYIDNQKLDKWFELNDINILNKEITFDIESVSTIKMKEDPNKIIIYAGIKGENEDFITDNYYIFDTKENSIDLINKWTTKIMRYTGTRWRNHSLSKREPAGFHFAKNTNFLEIPKEIEIEGYDKENEINILIDYKNNVHFINQEKKTVYIFKGDH